MNELSVLEKNNTNAIIRKQFPIGTILQGQLKINSRYFASVKIDENSYVNLIDHRKNNLHQGDIIKVKVIPMPAKIKLKYDSFGEIQKIVKRLEINKKHYGYIFTINKNNTRNYTFKNINKLYNRNWYKSSKHNFMDAAGQAVLIEFKENNKGQKRGKVIEKFGYSSKLSSNFQMALESDLTQELKNNLLQTNIIKEYKSRKDLTHLFTFSIDGPYSFEIDDAFSVVQDEEHYKVYIHIADPSAFIKKDSPLEKIAKKNNESDYRNKDGLSLMLPEMISINLLSFEKSFQRFAWTLELTINKDFSFYEKQKPKFYKSIIRLNRQETNTTFAKVLNNKKGCNLIPWKKYFEILKFIIEKTDLKKEDKDENAIKYFEWVSYQVVDLFMGYYKNFFITKISNIIGVIEHNFSIRNENQQRNKINKIKEKTNLPENIFEILLVNKIDSLKKINEISFYDFICLFYKNKDFQITLEKTKFTSPIRRYVDLYCHMFFDRIIFKRNWNYQLNFAKLFTLFIKPIAKEKLKEEINQKKIAKTVS